MLLASPVIEGAAILIAMVSWITVRGSIVALRLSPCMPGRKIALGDDAAASHWLRLAIVDMLHRFLNHRGEVHRMHIFCYAVVACVLLSGALVGRPSCAAEVGTRPEAQAHAVEADWTRARNYDVILDEFHFAPSRIVLQHGEPYALRLDNRGRFRHTFTAPEFFRAVAFRPGGAATEAAQSGGSLSIAAGEVVEIEFVPLQAGTYALECTKPLHGLFGMTGDIVVE